MAPSNIYFAGFNGFGQFKNLSKSITSLEEIQLTPQSGKIIIKSVWNYCAYAIDCKLSICGCVNGESQQERCFSFEYPIKDIACTENVCLILLETGIAYKMNRHTFQMDEINSTIIRQSLLANSENVGKIVGKLSAQHKNEPNRRIDEFITHIAASRSLSVVVTSKNNVYNMPLKIHTFSDHVKIKKICCGNEHCLILTNNGDLYAFGSSSRGQLGLGGLEPEETPVLIEALAGIKIIDMAAGGWHSVAVSAFNDLYVWGWNVNGQLGKPLFRTYESITKSGETIIERQKCSTVFATPVIVNLPKDNTGATSNNEDDFSENQFHPVGVSAGARHTIVTVEEGVLLAAGWNKFGQLASRDCADDVDQFQTVDKLLPPNCDIICGDWSTIAIDSQCNTVKKPKE